MTISRNATATDAGFRLQKLRAVKLILKEIGQDKESIFWCSLEQGADVVLKKVEEEKVSFYEEEDKHYEPESAFTLNSTQVLNTFVIFIDRLYEEKLSPHLKFGFYATNRIGKERSTNLTSSLGVTFPDYSILKALAENKLEDEVIQIASALIVEEYRVQYAKRNDGNLELINSWDLESWRRFFNRIDFSFKNSKIDKFHSELITDVKSCHLFTSVQHQDTEGIILGALLDKVEELQHKPNYSSRFIKYSDVELIFLKARTSDLKRIDPAGEVWNTILTDDDRTLDDKVISVSSEEPSRLIKSFKRKAAVGAALVSRSSTDKSLKATLYRIYDHVEDSIEEKRDDLLSMTLEEITNIIEQLTNTTYEMINSVQGDYSYSVNSRESIKDLILHLFDSCYLAFDKVDDE